MWKEKLNEIIAEKQSYGEKVNLGATDDEVSLFCDKVKDVFGVELPKEYVEFLKEINGVEFNGYILYGIDEEITQTLSNQVVNGFISKNENFYDNEELRRYIFIGESSISWYVYDLVKEKCFELDIPSCDIVEEFDSFGVFLESILNKSVE